MSFRVPPLHLSELGKIFPVDSLPLEDFCQKKKTTHQTTKKPPPQNSAEDVSI